MQLRALVVLTLAMCGIACSPPCDPVPSPLYSVCHVADAGPVAPDVSFVLEGTASNYGAVCDVAVDGGAIALSVTGSPACNTGGAADLRAPANPVKCTIPALAAGTYTVNSSPALTFTIPGDAGVPPCL